MIKYLLAAITLLSCAFTAALAKEQSSLIDSSCIIEPSFWRDVWSVSPNGRYGLVSSSRDSHYDCHLLEFSTSRSVGSFEYSFGHWSPNQRYVALRAIKTALIVFDTQVMRRLNIPAELWVQGISAPCWSPDSSELALTKDKQLIVFSLPKNKIILRANLDRKSYVSNWSPDGRFIACLVSSENPKYWQGSPVEEVIVFDRSKGLECFRLRLAPGLDHECGWSPDGALFICLDNRFDAKVFGCDRWNQVEQTTDEQRRLIPFWVDGLNSPDGNLSAITRNGKVEILNKNTGEVLVSKGADFKSFPFRFLQWRADSKRLFASWTSYSGFVDARSGQFQKNLDSRSVGAYLPLSDSVFRREYLCQIYPWDMRGKTPLPPEIKNGECLIQYAEPKSIEDCIYLLDTCLDTKTKEDFKTMEYKYLGLFTGGSFILRGEIYDTSNLWDLRYLAANLDAAGVQITDNGDLHAFIAAEYWKYLHPESKDKYPRSGGQK